MNQLPASRESHEVETGGYERLFRFKECTDLIARQLND